MGNDPRTDPRFRHFDDFSGDTWVAPAGDLRRLNADQLIEFKRLSELRRSEQLTLLFADVEPGYLEADETPTDPSQFLIGPRSVRFRAVSPIEADSYVDDGVTDWIWKAADSLAKRYALRLVEGESEWSGGAAWVFLTFAVPLRTDLSSVLSFNDELRQLLEHDPTRLDEDSMWELLRAGLPQGIVGCPESDWFEAKREPYLLNEVLGQLELAKDVSAFANSGGGILVIGLKTTSQRGIDVVEAVTPVDATLVNARTYRSALRVRLYPRLRGLELALTEVASGLVVVGIRIPRQPSGNLPVLVAGMPGVKARRSEGAYWGIFRRQGDASTPIVAAAVHTALRGGVL
jgi:hypothetical protein